MQDPSSYTAKNVPGQISIFLFPAIFFFFSTALSNYGTNWMLTFPNSDYWAIYSILIPINVAIFLFTTARIYIAPNETKLVITGALLGFLSTFFLSLFLWGTLFGIGVNNPPPYLVFILKVIGITIIISPVIIFEYLVSSKNGRPKWHCLIHILPVLIYCICAHYVNPIKFLFSPAIYGLVVIPYAIYLSLIYSPSVRQSFILGLSTFLFIWFTFSGFAAHKNHSQLKALIWPINYFINFTPTSKRLKSFHLSRDYINGPKLITIKGHNFALPNLSKEGRKKSYTMTSNINTGNVFAVSFRTDHQDFKKLLSPTGVRLLKEKFHYSFYVNLTSSRNLNISTPSNSCNHFFFKTVTRCTYRAFYKDLIMEVHYPPYLYSSQPQLNEEIQNLLDK